MQATASYSFFELFGQADIVVKSVMVMLMVASVFSWALIIEKSVRLRLMKKRSMRFEKVFHSGLNMEGVYNDARSNNNHPLAAVFLAAMREWRQNDIQAIVTDSSGSKKTSLKERLLGSMQIAINKSIQNLEVGLNMMAILGSAAPFIGLFGTVWGIMNSFQSIATMKNTNLAVVAPGIAEALLATGIGLFVAIPAVFFYNIFIARINRLYDTSNNFATEMLNILSRDLDR